MKNLSPFRLKPSNFLMKVLRVAFLIKGTILLIVGIICTTYGFIGSSIYKKLIKDSAMVKDCEDLYVRTVSGFAVTIGIIIILFSLTLFISALLCKRVMARNNYILQLEEKMNLNRNN